MKQKKLSKAARAAAEVLNKLIELQFFFNSE